MASRRRLLTEDEIRALNRKQFVDRIAEEGTFWENREDKGRMTDRSVASRTVFFGLLDKYADPFLLRASVLIGEHHDEVLAERPRDYWLGRFDGCPPRPPRRVQRSRRAQSRLPYGCRIVTRPGPYGNPVGSVDGDHSFPGIRFRNYLAARGRETPGLTWPYEYPDDDRIRRELGYWDLACWCPIRPQERDGCHADVLLRVAAGEPA